ncbi:MAG TPA: aminotransferase class I/II-fold pyridoxal phosphate-dependent enzyme [candidate division Zixibacteria bacterium]|nr:aminotransferase class I/II-fold pyridoxal phosphate-dependent enzyme [candidate division Zixibacteria bacterium]
MSSEPVAGPRPQAEAAEAASPDRFLSAKVRSMPPSGIRRFFDMLAEMKEVISLTIGEPDFTTPEPLTRAAIRSLEAGETHYTANGGMIELRRLIAADLERRHGMTYDPRSELVVTVGASEALDATLRAVCDPGDEVIYHEPAFVAYAPCIELAGGVPVALSTTDATDFRVTAEQVEAAITPRTRAVFLAYPNNPTGAVLSPGELEAIADVVTRHDLLAITDEIYERLVYADHRHVAIASLPGMWERTVHIGGFSKSYAMTGWRIGYVAAPAPLLAGIAKVHQYGIMCAPTPAQHAAIEALEHGEPFVEEMRAEYDRRRQLMTRRLNEIGLDCFEPKGAFYCFPNVSRATGLDDEEFAHRLLAEEHVAVVPGRAFGPSGAGYVRMCYATAYEQIEEAMDRIERFVERRRS